MAINATSKSNQDYAPVPAGVYPARCYSMVEIGTVPVDWQGERKWQKKVRITWELPTELKVFNEEKGAQPYSVSKEYTLSSHEKSNLRKMLENWRGKAFTDEEADNFDISKLLGVPCMLSVTHYVSKHNGKTYADIGSVSALAKGMTCPDQINPTFEFSLNEFDESKFNSLPDWLKDKIKTSEEYKKIANPEHTDTPSENAPDESGLPF